MQDQISQRQARAVAKPAIKQSFDSSSQSSLNQSNNGSNNGSVYQYNSSMPNSNIQQPSLSHNHSQSDVNIIWLRQHSQIKMINGKAYLLIPKQLAEKNICIKSYEHNNNILHRLQDDKNENSSEQNYSSFSQRYFQQLFEQIRNFQVPEYIIQKLQASIKQGRKKGELKNIKLQQANISLKHPQNIKIGESGNQREIYNYFKYKRLYQQERSKRITVQQQNQIERSIKRQLDGNLRKISDRLKY